MGIAHYLTTLYIDKAFGHNEAEYKKMTDTRDVLKMDGDHMAATRIAAGTSISSLVSACPILKLEF